MSKTLKTILIVFAALALIGVGFIVARSAGGGGQAQKQVTFSVTVTQAADFGLSISPTTLTLTQGEVGYFTVTTSTVGGYAGDLRLALTGLPEGSYTFTVNPLAAGSETTLAVNTATLEVQTYNCALTASEVADQVPFSWFLEGHADRVVDWAHAGIPGGIPNRTNITATVAPGESVSAAIAASSASGGGVVYLQPGIHNIAGLNFGTARNVTVRGAGPGQTILSTSAAIQFGANYFAYTTRYPVAGGCAKGATTITLASAPPANAVVGRLMAIEEDADEVLTFNATSDASRQAAHSHTCRIIAVDGNTITFDPPNLYRYPTSAGTSEPVYVRFGTGAPTSMCGIEDLTIRASGTVSAGVWYLGADRCWLKGVELTGFYGSYGMIRCDYSSQGEIRRCFIHDVYNWPNTGDGMGIYLWVQNDHFLVEDNVFYHTGMDVLVSNSSGHVIGYNFCWATGRTTTTAGCIPSSICLDHHAHPLMCLVEGNYISWITNDGTHGTSSHHTIFRNSINGLHPTLTGHRWMVTLAQGSYYHNIIGNILGDSSWMPTTYEMKMDGTNYGHLDSTIWKLEWPNDGNFHVTADIPLAGWTQTFPDPNVRGTAIIHGNYDYFHRSVHEWANEDHALPASLYHRTKPLWFGSLAWPAIGPDVSGLANPIPAKARWDAYATSGNLGELFR